MSFRVGTFKVLDPPEPIPGRPGPLRAIYVEACRRQAAREAPRFKVAANPTRLAVLLRLQVGPEHAGTLARELETPLREMGKHLCLMRLIGLVESDRRGHTVEYSLSESGRQIADLAAALTEEG